MISRATVRDLLRPRCTADQCIRVIEFMLGSELGRERVAAHRKEQVVCEPHVAARAGSSLQAFPAGGQVAQTVLRFVVRTLASLSMSSS